MDIHTKRRPAHRIGLALTLALLWAAIVAVQLISLDTARAEDRLNVIGPAISHHDCGDYNERHMRYGLEWEHDLGTSGWFSSVHYERITKDSNGDPMTLGGVFGGYTAGDKRALWADAAVGLARMTRSDVNNSQPFYVPFPRIGFGYGLLGFDFAVLPGEAATALVVGIKITVLRW